MRRCWWALFPSLLLAQASQAPVTLTAKCTAELVQTLSLPCTASEPCALFLELADVEAVGNRIVLTGNFHTGAATLESVLLVSDDGGKTWTEGHTRIAAAVLDQIQFLDFEAGWISGHLLQPVPKDAFLLLTSDGGKTWRKRSVSGESRTGVVEQFWFDSRNHGMLAIDRVRAAEGGLRYEIWESMTGGESWSVRQVNNEPLTVKRPPRERIWRIRPDAASKTNRIERREGTRWLSVAAFAVAAGECKPAEPANEEPPPPPTADETPAAAPASPAPPPSLRRKPPK